jgi:hypothetical protein
MNNIASTRMQSLIDEGQHQVPTLLQEIENERINRYDMIVKHSAIEIKRKPYESHISPLFVYTGSEPLDLTDHSESQMYSHYGIPRQYADKLIEWNMTSLLEQNFQTIGHEHLQNESVMLREINGTIKGWLSPSYKRMDAAPIIGTFVEENIKNGLVPIKAFNTDSRVQLRFAYPDVIIPNGLERESCLIGVTCTTSDYGGSAFKMEMFVLRLVCLNGMIGQMLFRQVHLGSRFTSEDAVHYLSKKTQDLDIRTLESGMKDLIKTLPPMREQIKTKIEQAFTKTPTSATWAEIKKNTDKGTNEAITNAFNTNLDIDLLPPEKSNWRLANAISLIAQQQKNADKRLDLENMAMKYIV